MPFLKEQIGFVNAALKQTALADARFQSGRIEGIAYNAMRMEGDKKEFFPALIGADNKPDFITVDDTYPIIIYHKIISSKYDIFRKGSQANDFGAGNQAGGEMMRMNTQVKMVVYGNYNQIKITRESLEGLLITNFPYNLPQQAASLKLSSLTVLPNSTTDFINTKVWNEEYQNVENRLSVEDIYFAIYYTIEAIFAKGCFKICDCN